MTKVFLLNTSEHHCLYLQSGVIKQIKTQQLCPADSAHLVYTGPFKYSEIWECLKFLFIPS